MEGYLDFHNFEYIVVIIRQSLDFKITTRDFWDHKNLLVGKKALGTYVKSIECGITCWFK